MTTSCSAGLSVSTRATRLASDYSWPAADFVHTKSRDRLLNDHLMAKLLKLVLAASGVRRLLSSGHFSVDGSQLQASAFRSSLQPIDGIDATRGCPVAAGDSAGSPARRGSKPGGDFRGLLLSNQTHHSRTDQEAWRFRRSWRLSATWVTA